jgi:hypothetical protein
MAATSCVFDESYYILWINDLYRRKPAENRENCLKL